MGWLEEQDFTGRSVYNTIEIVRLQRSPSNIHKKHHVYHWRTNNWFPKMFLSE
jgi:hypothetical protein